MRRPKLVHFTCIESDDYINVRASMTFSTQARFELMGDLNKNLKNIAPEKPIQAMGLLSSNEFRLKVIGLSENDQLVLSRSFESDNFGNFHFKIPQNQSERVVKLKLYEIKSHPGLEFLIGSIIPTKIQTPKKILITDFDKTLVDTKYSSLKEVYISLNSPIHIFPPVENSIKIMKDFIEEQYQPFVVSASPHFYENAIRDWLYKRNIFTSNIFLKDYRSIFSFFSGDLSTKDIKSQGFYKLNTIVNILLMTGIPEELVLIGDGFESDALIYLCIAAILLERYDPWIIWNKIKKEESFKLNNQQHFRFLSKFYQLKNLADGQPRGKIQIFIRCKKDMIEKLQNRNFKLDFANQLKNHVHYYVG